MWVDDAIVWARDAETLLTRVEAVLERLIERGLFAAAHKAVLFRREIKWCGRIYSGEATIQDPARVQGLLDLRRPETGGELMHFLQALNWVR